MTVLITRAIDDATTTAHYLEQQTIQTLIDPMIKVTWPTHKAVDLSSFEHIIFTSKNGVRSFCHHYHTRNLTAWCVGKETAFLAKEKGFHQTHSADGSSQDLEKFISKKQYPAPMIRVARANHKDLLSDTLEKNSYPILRLPLYMIEGINSLSDETIKAINTQSITDIVFFSPYTAQITANNITKAKVRDACREIRVWCISKKTAHALKPLDFKEIIVAQNPNQDDLLIPLIKRIHSDDKRKKI